jgi:predicted AAA+ superfamily ATPase
LKSGSCYEQKNLYYWHRESKNSNAEVDFIVQFGQNIIPIEVKSGAKGAMQSMRLFLESKCSPFGIRASLENFGELQKIKIVPLYGIGHQWYIARK